MIFEYPCSSTTECQPIPVDLLPGRYFIECYGAQGGTGLSDSDKLCQGGRGAYASGMLNLRDKTTFYLYIGGQGQDGIDDFHQISLGGWNGGGNGGADLGWNGDIPDSPGAGGGATDIRLVRAPSGEESTDIESLNSRIIVAAGGSGSGYKTYGGPGGDLNGYQVSDYENKFYHISETNQTAGNALGKGADGQNFTSAPSTGAGGGYYGGNAGDLSDHYYYQNVASSGSSYVAGFEGCPEFSNELGVSFGFVLLNPVIKNGFTSFPKVDYKLTHEFEEGHAGNGAIRISLIHFCSYRRCSKGSKTFFVISLISLIKNE